MDWFWQCWVNSISTLSEIICIFNFLCPFTFIYFICFKMMQHWRLESPPYKMSIDEVAGHWKSGYVHAWRWKDITWTCLIKLQLTKVGSFFDTQCSIIASLVVILFNCSVFSSTYQASSFQLINLVTVQYLQCSENKRNINKTPFYERLTSIGWHGAAMIDVSDLHSRGCASSSQLSHYYGAPAMSLTW